MGKFKTTEEFIADSRKVHGDRFDYSLALYLGKSIKVKIICPKHGVFEQTPENHLRGGCKRCATGETANKNMLTHEEFLVKAKQVHGDRFDYSLAKYTGQQKKIKIICHLHGLFNQFAGNHLRGAICRNCAKQPVITTSDFIADARRVHGDRYDYSKAIYKASALKMKIICSIHGAFQQSRHAHLKGNGCSKCARSQKITNRDFITRAKAIHGDRYDYSHVNFKGIGVKVKLKCPDHGFFKQGPYDHLKGHGCKQCVGKHTISTEEFVQKAIAVHGDRYDYSLVNYKRATQKVELICKTKGHGRFKQVPGNHLNGQGCPKCNNSKGEVKICKVLEKKGIEFFEQKRFKECRHKRTLPFDFYIPSMRMLIEYDGKQHFIEDGLFNKAGELTEIKTRDKIKDGFAQKHNYRLLRIPYTDYDRIEEILQTALGEKSEASKAGEQLALFF